jgi:hypothetical protein
MGTSACRSVGGNLDEYLVETLKVQVRMSVPKPDSAAEVWVQLCGRFAFMVASRAVHYELPGRRARLLLAYLAAHRDRPTGRIQLLDALWPGGGAHAAATLNVVLSKVGP